jgi:hypothetical protein
MKQVIRLTESDLHRIVKESVNRILNEERVDEGWKDWAMAGALGAASMFGNPQTAYASNPQPQVQTIQQQKNNSMYQLSDNTKPKADKFFMERYGNTKYDYNSDPRCQKEVKYLVSICDKDFKHPSTGESLRNLLGRMRLDDGSEVSREILNHILFINPKTGKYITADNPTYEDMMYIDAYFTCQNDGSEDAFDGHNVIIANIGGVNYFINIGNLFDYQW